MTAETVASGCGTSPMMANSDRRKAQLSHGFGASLPSHGSVKAFALVGGDPFLERLFREYTYEHHCSVCGAQPLFPCRVRDSGMVCSAHEPRKRLGLTWLNASRFHPKQRFPFRSWWCP